METLFRSLGFTDTESRVYLGLVDGGGSSAGILSKRINIPRTTVYSALEVLIEKGVVSQHIDGRTTRFVANPPSSLRKLVQVEKEEITRKEEIAEELAAQLGPFFLGKAFESPRLQVFRGRRNVALMLNEYTPIWRRSMQSEDFTWWGYQDHTFVEGYREWLDATWRTMDEMERIQLVSNKVPLERKLRGAIRGREIRVLDDDIAFSSTIWVLGHFIVMISSKSEPHYAFQIKDESFAHNLRVIFKVIWKLAS